MDSKYLKPLQELDYAPLENNEQGRLKEMESQFNNEFGTDYYFMVMKREK